MSVSLALWMYFTAMRPTETHAVPCPHPEYAVACIETLVLDPTPPDPIRELRIDSRQEYHIVLCPQVGKCREVTKP